MFVPGEIFQTGLTNTLALYENSQIIDKKSFITFAPGVKVIKLFSFAADDEA